MDASTQMSKEGLGGQVMCDSVRVPAYSHEVALCEL
jgi:hypothetical protein